MSLDPAVAAVRVAVRPYVSALDAGDTVMVACSGGADSLALLAAAVFEGHRAGVRVIGAVVDHGLQDGSAEHTARVVAQMAGLGADETLSARVQVDVAGQGVEAAAREARYAVLEQAAASAGARTVLLGHTLDDQAETVLLGLTRGSGGRSMAGMRPAFDVFARPLLDVRRAQTEAACRAEGIEYWSDPHNVDSRFTRARVRHTVLPLLEAELGPGVAETLARTAALLRPDMEALDDAADLLFLQARSGDGLDLEVLADQAPALRTRALRLAALAAGAPASELFHVHVQALDALATVGTRGGRTGQVQLPGRVTAVRDGGRLRFTPTAMES